MDFHRKVIESGDKRINDWPFVSSPMPTITLTVAYLYFVKYLGPRLMKNRPAFTLRGPMIFYNFLMVVFSFYEFYEMGKVLRWGAYNLQCRQVDYSNSESALRFCYLGYYFFLSKFVEFFDTIFFILRKKHDQVSTLHVYHHSVVPITMWVGMKYAPGGNNSFFPFLNAGVHSVMYFYYGLSACGPVVKPLLFWKKYLTTLQLAQFTAVLIHGIYSLCSGCEFPKAFLLLNLFHAFVFFYLFFSFYRNSYKHRKQTSQTKIDSVNNSSTSGNVAWGLVTDAQGKTSATIPGLTITASFSNSTKNLKED